MIQSLDLQQAVEEAVWQYGQIRPNLTAISVEVSEHGTVVLAGPVRSNLVKGGILQVVRQVRGVRQVVDHLTSDPELELAVANALAADKATRDLRIAVHSHLGVVTLVGKATEEAARLAAIEISGRVPGVRGVSDRLSA